MTQKEKELIKEIIGPGVIPTFTFEGQKFVRLEFVMNIMKALKEVLKNG